MGQFHQYLCLEIQLLTQAATMALKLRLNEISPLWQGFCRTVITDITVMTLWHHYSIIVC